MAAQTITLPDYPSNGFVSQFGGLGSSWSAGAGSLGPGRGRFVVGPGQVVLRHRLAHQVLVEPVDDVLEPLDAVPGLAGSGKFVRLAGEADHDGGFLSDLE